MEVVKIHTSNKDKVEAILKTLVIEGDFWDYTLSYEYDYKNHDFYDLENEHYFNMPEFAWSPYLKERWLINVYVKNQQEKDALYKAFGVKETKGLVNKGKDAVDEVVPPELIKPVTTDVPLKVPKAKGIEQPISIQKFIKANFHFFTRDFNSVFGEFLYFFFLAFSFFCTYILLPFLCSV